MTQVIPEILSVLKKNKIEISHVEELQKEYFNLADQIDQREELEEWLEAQDKGGDKLKKALVHWLLDQWMEAEEILSSNKNLVAYYLLCRIYLAREKVQKAFQILSDGLKKFPNNWDLEILLAKIHLQRGQEEEAKKLLAKLEKADKKNREIRFMKAYLIELSGEYDQAVEEYESLLEDEPDHLETHFRLAYHESLRGDEDRAIELYEYCQQATPLYVHPWINLGVLYEDREDYAKAVECFQGVLRVYDSHQRAWLYLEDCQMAQKMYYDEDSKRKTDKKRQILRTPISDFELSVRARNCLNNMNISTLEDLIEKSEDELLAYKNFGENSLREINEVLTRHKLSLGEGRRRKLSPILHVDHPEEEMVGTPSEEMLNQAITDFDFNKRSLNCMQNLGIETLGDILAKSEPELMRVKNFGKVSLQNIKRKLAEYGLHLRQE